MKVRPLSFALFLGLSSVLSACPSGGGGSNEAPSKPSASPSARASAAAPPASASAAGIKVGGPAPAEKVAKALNPLGEAPYSGPTGTLKGKVRIEGDEPPDTGLTIPAKCNEAVTTYGKLFRVGLDKALADALVAVTGYKGFVPPRDVAAKVTIHGCAFSRRTVAVTFGQRIEVSNLDPVDPYMPYLDGGPSGAMMVAVPKGDAVKLYPTEEKAHYLIRDQLPNDFLRADVYVLAFATHDVTGLDGQYEIKDIPVGPVKVSAYLPAIDRTVDKAVEIKAGENVADLTLRYDKAGKDAAAPSARPAAPKGSAKAGGAK